MTRPLFRGVYLEALGGLLAGIYPLDSELRRPAKQLSACPPGGAPIDLTIVNASAGKKLSVIHSAQSPFSFSQKQR